MKDHKENIKIYEKYNTEKKIKLRIIDFIRIRKNFLN